jgi:hypothetical protein
MGQHAYLVGAIVIGLAFVGVVYLVYTRTPTDPGQRRPWFHYLLLWPLILDADKSKRGGRLLTTRELLGWGIVALVALVAIVFT